MTKRTEFAHGVRGYSSGAHDTMLLARDPKKMLQGLIEQKEALVARVQEIDAFLANKNVESKGKRIHATDYHKQRAALIQERFEKNQQLNVIKKAIKAKRTDLAERNVVEEIASSPGGLEDITDRDKLLIQLAQRINAVRKELGEINMIIGEQLIGRRDIEKDE